MAGDPYYDSVSLLLHCEGSNGSTTFTDNSPRTKTATAVANAQISTADFKWGASCGTFDGTGDWLTLPHHADFNFGSGDWTFEAWIKPTAVAGDYVIFVHRPTVAARGVVFSFNTSGKLVLYAGDSNTSGWEVALVGTSVVSTTAWSHVVCGRSGSNWYIGLNGTQEATATASFTVDDASGTVYICGADAGTVGYHGEIDDVRITKGVWRGLSVPTEAFPNMADLVLTGISASFTGGSLLASSAVAVSGLASEVQYGIPTVTTFVTAQLAGAEVTLSESQFLPVSSARVSGGAAAAVAIGGISISRSFNLVGRQAVASTGTPVGFTRAAIAGTMVTLTNGSAWPALGLKSLTGITSSKGLMSKSGSLVLGGSEVVAEAGNAYPSMVFSQTGQSVATAVGAVSSARQKALIGNMTAVSENVLNFASSDKQAAITGNLITFSAGTIYIGPDPWYNFLRVLAVDGPMDSGGSQVVVILEEVHRDITVIQLA